MTRDTVISFVTTALRFVATLAISIIVSRSLGPAGKGTLAVILLTATVLAQLANVGLGGSIIYHIGRGRYPLPQIISGAAWLSLGLGMLVTVAFLAFYSASRSSLFEGVPPTLLVLTTAITPLGMLSFCFNQILVGQKRILRYSALTMLALAVSLLLILALVVVAKMGLTGVVIANVLSGLAVVVVGAILVLRTSRARLVPNLRVVRSLSAFGAKTYLGPLVSFLTLRTDTYFIKLFSGLEAVGYYSISNALTNPLLLLASSVDLVLLPRTSSLSSRQSGELTSVATRNVVLLSSIGGLALLVGGKFLIEFLYGKAFLPAFMPLAILLPGLVLRGADKTLSAYVLGQGRPLICTSVAVIAFLIGITLYFLLIPSSGIVGAALASSLSYGTGFLLMLVAFTRMSGKKASDALLPRRADLKLYASAWTRFTRWTKPSRSGWTS